MEIWKPVIEYEKLYEVSDCGRVRRIGRNILKPGFAKGYFKVSLYSNGQKRDFTIHRIVARAFIGISDGQLRHLDGDLKNNTPGNLAYGTAKDNAKDRQEHGRTQKGERHYRAKLNDDLVRKMRRLAEDGFGPSAIGRMVGMSKVRAHEVITRKTWKHI